MKRLTLLLLFIVLVSQAQQPTPTFKASTDLVLVPVVVTRDGKPVTGLTRSDFALSHDHQTEPIAIFEEVTATAPPSQAPAAAPNYATNYGTGDSHNDVYIVLLDFLNARWESAATMRAYMRDFAEKFANTHTRVAVLLLSPNGLVQAHSFTTDPNELLKAIDNWSRKQHIDPRTDPFQPSSFGSIYSATSMTGTEDVFNRLALPASYLNKVSLDKAAMTTQALEQISSAFGGVPGRKRLIWVSTGFPTVNDADNRPSYEFNIHDRIVRAWQALSANNIVVYPIDSNGGPVNPMFDPHGLPNTSSMLEVAERTGGRTCVDLLNNCMERTMNADKHYYLLGFYLHGPAKVGWHKLKVELSGQKADVRARSGFMVADEKIKTRQDDHDIVFAALASPLDYTGIPLAMRWKDASLPDKRQIEIEFATPPGGISIDSATGNMELNLLVFIRPVGKPDGQSYPATLVATLSQDKQKVIIERGFHYSKVVPVTPGEYDIKLFLRDNIGHKIGTVSAPLKIQ